MTEGSLRVIKVEERRWPELQSDIRIVPILFTSQNTLKTIEIQQWILKCLEPNATELWGPVTFLLDELMDLNSQGLHQWSKMKNDRVQESCFAKDGKTSHNNASSSAAESIPLRTCSLEMVLATGFLSRLWNWRSDRWGTRTCIWQWF